MTQVLCKALSPNTIILLVLFFYLNFLLGVQALPLIATFLARFQIHNGVVVLQELSCKTDLMPSDHHLPSVSFPQPLCP